MSRRSSSIKRPLLCAAFGTLLLVLAGCGTNPVAPVTSSNLVGLGKAVKNPNHMNGRVTHSPQYSRGSGDTSGSGAASGPMTDPWEGECGEMVIE
jgi:hypothetical protein